MYIPEIVSTFQLKGIHCSDGFREQLVKTNRRRTKVIPCLLYFHKLVIFCYYKIVYFGVSLFLANETKPPIAPKFMVSSAELGTITIDPFSFKPSNSIFIPLRCNATGLSVYFLLACSNFSADFRFCRSKHDNELFFHVRLGPLCSLLRPGLAE